MKAHFNTQAAIGPRSPYAPALIGAYALGATLWSPALVVAAELAVNGVSWLLPWIPMVDSGRLFVAAWLLRFGFYLLGARNDWNYGYGINGVIVNRALPLSEKLRRIVTDWFGVALIMIWLWFMPGLLDAALAQ